MKHFRPLAAAIALTVTALAAGFAHAEPKKEAPYYYLLGVTTQQASLMSTSVEHTGYTAETWLLSYLPTPQIATDGTQFQSLWFLTDFNCQANTVEIKEIDVISPEGKKIVSLPGDGKSETPQKGGTGYAALQIACARDYPAKVLTAQQVTEGLKRYEAVVRSAQKKSTGDDSAAPQH